MPTPAQLLLVTFVIAAFRFAPVVANIVLEAVGHAAQLDVLFALNRRAWDPAI